MTKEGDSLYRKTKMLGRGGRFRPRFKSQNQKTRRESLSNLHLTQEKSLLGGAWGRDLRLSRGGRNRTGKEGLETKERKNARHQKREPLGEKYYKRRGITDWEEDNAVPVEEKRTHRERFRDFQKTAWLDKGGGKVSEKETLIDEIGLRD